MFSAGFRRIPRLAVVLSSDTPILLRSGGKAHNRPDSH